VSAARLALALLSLVLLACGLPAVRGNSTPVPPPPTVSATLPRVAYLWPGLRAVPTGPPLIDLFRASLTEHGWEAGKNVTFESVSAEQDTTRYPQLIARLVASRPDVIVVGDSAAAPLVAEATHDIPIVLTLGGNVVAAGQACRVNRPCGNVTGLSISLAPLSPKRLELLTEIVPGLQRVGFLRNSAIPETQLELDAVQAAAPTFGVTIVPLQFRALADLERVFQDALDQQIDALLVMPDGISLVAGRVSILRFAADHDLPDAYGVRDIVRDGGLFSYGADRTYNLRRAAFYVDRLLRGAQPAELPIEQPDRFELVINLARAERLGLTFPDHILLQANDAVR
jgi:putative tryptophan/tyrosine transport system substrate-binding protein